MNMYKSPIEIFESPIHDVIKQMNEEKENYIYQCVADIGVNIDKEELIKALQYDRDQYEQGYRDGMQANKWISVEDRLPEKGGKYLVHYHDDIIGEYVIIREYWEKAGKFAPMEYFEEHIGRKAMHWMSLPEPPRRKGELI